jgi:hypothetical protein
VNIVVPEVLPLRGSLLNAPIIVVDVSPLFALRAKGCDIKLFKIKS